MPDSIDNPIPPPSAEPPFTPMATPMQPMAPPPQKSGSSALKIILIIVAIFVGLGIIAAGMVGYGIYRVAHAIHKSADGQISLNTPGGTLSANSSDSASESDLGIAIYPGATQVKGGLHMSIAGKSMVTANFLTADSKDQVVAFYKDKAGPDARSTVTANGAEFVIKAPSVSTAVNIVQSSSLNDGKTLITIVHTSGISSN